MADLEDDAARRAARRANDLFSYHEKLRSAPGRVVWRDETTGAQVLRVAGFPRLVWWYDLMEHTPEEMKACFERYQQWRDRKSQP